MEDYKVKFEKLIQRIDDLIANGWIDENTGKAILKDFTLESEDENINQFLISFIKMESGVNLSPDDAGKILSWVEKQGEQNIKMIQWKGDNLREVVEFTGKSPKFNEWFKTWDDFENYVHSHGNIFKLFCEDGSYYEVPVVAWIVKTHDGYNVASKAIYVKKLSSNQSCFTQSANKVEPKFKVGDWITNDIDVDKIIGIDLENEDYLFENNTKSDISLVESISHIWTIQDAKDGDVLYSLDSNRPFIYKERNNYEQATAYCGLNIYGKFFVWGTKDCVITLSNYVQATKEQRDLLFSKMKEAGYEWDAEKKELKKIEQNPAWSEEDERMIKEAVRMIAEPGSFFKGTELTEKVVSWLKSLKDRYTWKPSGEQIETLEQWLRDSRYKCYHIIDSLYQDLKKLREK